MGLRALFNGDGWSLATPLFLEGEVMRLQAHVPEQLGGVLSSLDDIAASKDTDLIAVGFMTYEAGVLLEGSTSLFREPEGTPLAAFGVYSLRDASRGAAARPQDRFTFDESATPTVSFSPDEWARGVETIRAGIACGDVYQVNLTRRTRLRAGGDPFALAGTLFRENPVPYALSLAGDGWAVVSNSPELFLDADFAAARAASAPIKGTARRQATFRKDAEAVSSLLASAKDAAEHIMIVDLIRNDLGRSAVPGGVSVWPLRQVKTFRHLHHLESTVRARLSPGVRPSDLLKTTLPGGSITGAPKRAALRFIRGVEPCARGAYTGAAGYVRGSGRAIFNVAIRTAILHAGFADYHAGGGIVWDSDMAAEWAETETKSIEFAAAVAGNEGGIGRESGG